MQSAVKANTKILTFVVSHVTFQSWKFAFQSFLLIFGQQTETVCKQEWLSWKADLAGDKAHTQAWQSHGVPESIFIHELLIQHNQSRWNGHVDQACHQCGHFFSEWVHLPVLPQNIWGYMLHSQDARAHEALKLLVLKACLQRVYHRNDWPLLWSK